MDVITDPDNKNFGSLEYNEASGLTKMQLEAIQGGSVDLVAKAIIVRDMTMPGPKGGRYDLTAKFLDQYLTFSFSQHDDLLDASSRIYDMDPTAPIAPSARQERVTVYCDGV